MVILGLEKWYWFLVGKRGRGRFLNPFLTEYSHLNSFSWLFLIFFLNIFCRFFVDTLGKFFYIHGLLIFSFEFMNGCQILEEIVLPLENFFYWSVVGTFIFHMLSFENFLIFSCVLSVSIWASKFKSCAFAIYITYCHSQNFFIVIKLLTWELPS